MARKTCYEVVGKRKGVTYASYSKGTTLSVPLKKGDASKFKSQIKKGRKFKSLKLRKVSCLKVTRR